VKQTSVSEIGAQINSKILSTQSLVSHLQLIQKYLTHVCEKRVPPNQQILSQLQDIFNLAPNHRLSHMTQAFSIKTNDMMQVIYLSSMIRSVIALHSLINNKRDYAAIERAADVS